MITSKKLSKRKDISHGFFNRVGGKSIGIYHNKVSLTQIIAIGELEINGKVKKRTTQQGSSKEISTSTLVVASDGQFNQQTASKSLKIVLEAIIKDSLK